MAHGQTEPQGEAERAGRGSAHAPQHLGRAEAAAGLGPGLARPPRCSAPRASAGIAVSPASSAPLASRGKRTPTFL